MTATEWALQTFESKRINEEVHVKVDELPETWVSLPILVQVAGEAIEQALANGTSLYDAIRQASMERGAGWEKTRNYVIGDKPAIFASWLDACKARGILT